MSPPFPRYIVLALSLLLAVFIIISSCLGLFVPGIYSRETPVWQAQTGGQDIIDLFLVAPSLIICSILAFNKDRQAMLIWPGIHLYIIYTFTIFSFDIHFNQLFIFYCIILGLSVYLFLWFMLSNYREPIIGWFDEILPNTVIGMFLIILGGLFYAFWLTDVIPSIIQRKVPGSIETAGLFTNPVQVLDLSIYLPGVILTGALLLRKHPIGLLLTPGVLFFCTLMYVTIGALAVALKLKGIESSWMVPICMSVLALFSAVLLILFLRSLRLYS